MKQKILIVDFGSKFTQLIARRIRDLKVYCEIFPYNKMPEITDDVKGIILSGSPISILNENAPNIDLEVLVSHSPVLGIGYGAQLIVSHLGGQIEKTSDKTHGTGQLKITDKENPLFKNLQESSKVWLSHTHRIKNLPNNSTNSATVEEMDCVAFKIDDREVYGTIFHPEVSDTEEGITILKNFLLEICKCSQSHSPETFAQNTISDLKTLLGDDKVIMALSGGVDSSVAAWLIHQAIGSNLYCIFVDHGLLRKNEFEQVLESYKGLGLNVKGVDAKDRFYAALKGKEDPEEKRKAIGKTFIDIFDDEAHKIEDAKWLGQGTIYPDVIESVSVGDSSVSVKSHHNVGGLPDYMKLKLVEPLRLLFKDEVRQVGKALNLSDHFLMRHPFPGPGLGIRILGEVSPERVTILQNADAVYIDLLKERGLYNKIWQAGAILLPIKSVGVSKDKRTYENVVALRAVVSVDGMTADWVHLPYDFLAEVSNKIINTVEGVNRVVYDVSSKPPATIEWE